MDKVTALISLHKKQLEKLDELVKSKLTSVRFIINKIKFVANRDTNYVFHMLSVAKCGYDNEYGEKYRTRYS